MSMPLQIKMRREGHHHLRSRSIVLRGIFATALLASFLMGSVTASRSQQNHLRTTGEFITPFVKERDSNYILEAAFDKQSQPATEDTSEFLRPDEFTFAGRPRYVLDGSQPRRITKLKPITFAAVQSVYIGGLTLLHIYQKNTIWSSTTSFRLIDNWDESFGANYGGHMLAGYFLSYLSAESLLASGLSKQLSTIYGALMGLGYQFYVEVLDGYGLNYGLSPYEMYSNILGVIYYLGSAYSPFLQNFTPKFNYYPAPSFGEHFKVASKTPIDDYSSWNFWITANVPHLLSDNYSSFWPKWLDLSFGYSARNLGYPDRSRIYTIALDYDLEEILPDGGPTWNWFKHTLNFLKLPSPTWEIWSNRSPRFYLLYPFRLSLGNVNF